MKTVFIKNFGCKVNAFDGQVLADLFLKEGFTFAKTYQSAELVVLNTCSVTEKAEKEVVYFLKRLKREVPGALLAVTGCYAKAAEKKLVEMRLADIVVPHEQKRQLVKIIKEYIESGTTIPLKEDMSSLASQNVFFGTSFASNTRAFIKVQDGCDSFCSYCIVPFARGRSVSVPEDAILEEVRRQMSRGTKEIVLTGVHIGNYGKDIQDGKSYNLSSLMKSILSLEGLCRVRLSSLEITDMTDELLSCLAEYKNKFCDHLHLPLQSGSPRILKLMNRHYNSEDFLKIVEKFRGVFPKANIGTDVIVGFPGEDDDDFDLTLKLLSKAEISYCHVFPFSVRPGTKAAEMPKKVAGQVIKERAKMLRSFSSENEKIYAKGFLGQNMEVLWEGDLDHDQRPLGKTRNYLNVAYEKFEENSSRDTLPQKGTVSLTYLQRLSKDGTIIGRASS